MGGAPLLFGPAEPCSPGPPVVPKAQYPQGYRIRNRYYNRFLSPLSTSFFREVRAFSTKRRSQGPASFAHGWQALPERPSPQSTAPVRRSPAPARSDGTVLQNSTPNRPVCTPFAAAVSAPNRPLEPLTAFQALFHRVLWIFSLCVRGFCVIMDNSYEWASPHKGASAAGEGFPGISRRVMSRQSALNGGNFP